MNLVLVILIPITVSYFWIIPIIEPVMMMIDGVQHQHSHKHLDGLERSINYNIIFGLGRLTLYFMVMIS